MLPSFSSWRTVWLLSSNGLRDEALLYLVSVAPFSSPSDRDVAAIGERCAEDCLIALDENVLWCRVPRLQGERILKLVRSGELALSVHAFEPNSPDVLSGSRARLLSVGAVSLRGLPTAYRQPADGFKTPHHVRASLKLGSRANLPGLRQQLRLACVARAVQLACRQRGPVSQPESRLPQGKPGR